MKKTIDFAEGLHLPIEVASSPIALLAQRGRGKTRAAKKLAEAFHAAGVPPVILDPAGVWWGLRLAADGRSRGLDLPVLGGLHGDQALVPTGGKVLAEALVRTRRGCVIDTTGFASEGEKKRFITDFAETFLRQKMQHRTPVHLILEEADEWIPEQPSADEARMLGAFGRIVRIGRNFGVGISMISQRPQGISKKVLNLSEVVIVLGMAGAHEQAAMKRWMDDHDVTPERRAEVLEKMPRLGWNKFTKSDGGALIWAPLLDLFGVYKVKEPATLDSSATPEVGDDGEAAPLPSLDMDDLAKAMAATVEEAKANDPKLLRAEIAKLRAELAKKPTATYSAPPEVRVEREYLIPNRTLEVLEELKAAAHGRAESAQAADAAIWKAVDALAGEIRRVTTPARTVHAGGHGYAGAGGKAVHGGGRAAPLPRPAAVPPREPMAGGERIAPGALGLLKALAQRHPTPLNKNQLATLGQMKVTGGAFRTYVSWLRVRGYLQGSESISLTEAGLDAAGPIEAPQTSEELIAMWKGKLAPGAAKMLDVLVGEYPETITREGLAKACEMELTGGAFRTYLSKLRVNGLAESNGDDVRASDNLFPEAA